MIFSSIEFIFLFLPIFIFSIFFFNKNKKNILIISSIIFMYIAEKEFIFTVSVIAFLNFYLARDNFTKTKLIFGIFINLLILFVYKYLNFFSKLFNISDQIIELALPVGISFITFHSISYLVDVFRKKIPPENKLSDFYLFIFMFPQVIAGPITRYSNIYKKIKTLTNKYFNVGIYLFFVGLCQKVLIADQLGLYVNEVYNLPVKYISYIDSLITSFFYVIQLYFDFSGYTNMAIGLGYLIGVKLPINFNYPLSSFSIGEFWSRWHISLSTFIRDYLFIPINKFFNISKNENSLRYYLSIIFCFLLSGLWHGANLTFIIWGLIHGIAVVVEKILGISKKNFLTKIYFLIVLSLSFVYFRSPDISYANNFILNIINFENNNNFVFLQFMNIKFIMICILSIIFLSPLNCIQFRKFFRFLNNHSLTFIFISPLFIIIVCELLLNSYNPFIYFRF